MSDYWRDTIEEAFEDAGIKATKEQTDLVTSWVEGAQNNYSLATGADHIPNPLMEEIKELSHKLTIEKAKSTCKECCGTGGLVSVWGDTNRSASTQCDKCRGAGRV